MKSKSPATRAAARRSVRVAVMLGVGLILMGGLASAAGSASGTVLNARPLPDLVATTDQVSNEASTTPAEAGSAATWVTQTSGTTKDLNAVFFIDEMTGWAVGNDATVVHTVDGGDTWNPVGVPVGSDVDLTGIDFVDSQSGWIAGNGGDAGAVILHTPDGGSTWSIQSIPNLSGGVWSGLQDVDFADELHGVVGGTMVNANFNTTYSMAVTWDGGELWKAKRQTTEGQVNISDVEMVNHEVVWGSGEDRLYGTPGVMKSIDGGDTCSEIGRRQR